MSRLLRFHLGAMVLALFPWDSLACGTEVSAARERYRGMALAHNVRTRPEVAEVLAAADATGGRLVKLATDAPWSGHSARLAGAAPAGACPVAPALGANGRAPYPFGETTP